MGIIFTQGNKDRAPEWSCSTFGRRPWSSLAGEAISPSDIFDMVEFCKFEGYRKGWNHMVEGSVDIDASNIFDKHFLRDVPYHAWRSNYAIGVYERAHEEGIEPPALLNVSEIDVVENAIALLNEDFSVQIFNPSVSSLRRDL